MARLFVGLELPEDIKHQLLKVQGRVPGARWQTAEQLHLTLNFIGDADALLEQNIRQALQDLPSPAFEIALAGVGRFGKPGRPGALWAGVVPEAPVIALQRQIGGRLAAIGLRPESRPYKPHVTLARLRASNEESKAFLQAHADLASVAFPITRASLFSSVLGEGGSRYQVIGRFPLTG